MNIKSKIQLSDTLMDILVKLSEGNPGGASVLAMVLKEDETIDPDNALGGLGSILFLDTLGIYGSRIWMLYKDVCEQNLSKMLGVLRGCQLGIISKSVIHAAIDNYGEGLDVDDVCAKVVKELPNFKLS